MSRPPEFFRRLFLRPVRYLGRIEERCVRARPGSVLILVVALLVLMAMMGTAFISTSRSDRFSSQQNSFNTEVDLLINAVCKIEQTRILNATGSPLNTPSGTSDSMIWTSTADSNWFGSRVPVTLSNGSPGWAQVASAPTGTTFESPYTPPSTTGPLTYTTYQNLAPTSLTIPTPAGSASYPALTDISTNTTYLAASATGSGIADAPLWRLPIGQVNGVTYYAGVFLVDNGSAVNASTAYEPNPLTGQQAASNGLPPLVGNFFPSNIDLNGMLHASSTPSVQDQMTALNTYRFNSGAASQAAYYDDGTAASYSFVSTFDAMWSQLGRRLDYPGMNAGTRYQALPIGESAAMGHRYCLTNPAASPSILETALEPSVMYTGSGAAIPGTPYSPDQVANWFNNNFVYDNGGGNIRPLLVARNQVSNIAASCFTQRNAWDSSVAYNFGDWVNSGGYSYVCVQDNSGQAPMLSDTPTNVAYWAQEPWTDYPVKTSINTATFGQLWASYWGVMSAGSPGNPDTASAATIFRNPLRSAVTVAGNGTNNSNSAATTVTLTPQAGDNHDYILGMANSAPAGATIAFSPGTYLVGSPLLLPGNHLYTGGGTPSNGIASLTPTEVLRLRSALASINTEQLRSATTDVISRFIFMGGAVQPAPASGLTGGAIITGPSGAMSFTFSNDTNVEVTGFVFDTAGVQISASQINFHDNTLQNQSNNCLYITGMYNSQINNNTFNNMSAFGIVAYPANNNTFDYNTFTNVYEAMHILGGSPTAPVSNEDFSNNTITQASRHGIELQLNVNNMTCNNNYMADWLNPASQMWMGLASHMGISAANGQKGPPWVGGGNGMTIEGNTILLNGLPGQNLASNPVMQSCVELMGQNITVANNYLLGGIGLLNGAIGKVTTSNNTIVAYQGVANGDSTPWPVDPITLSSSDRVYNPDAGNAPAPPTAAQTVGATTTSTPTPPAVPVAAVLQYRVMLYGSSVQPYITEVYANNDQSTNGGFIAVALYNPYSTTISLKNWQWVTVARNKGESQLVINSLTGSPMDLSALLPAGLAPGQRVVFESSSSPPTGVVIDPSVTTPPIVIPQLNTAFNLELMLMRPRRADGTLTTSSASVDANNVYDETPTAQTPVANLYDLVPVDSYDLTGLPAQPSQDDQDSAEWHYVRPSDAAHNWWFVYPYTYNIDPTQNPTPAPTPPNKAEPIPMPRLFATLVTSALTPAGAANFGAAASAPANTLYAAKGFPIQINNTDFGGPKNQAAAQFPFGEFARNGDLLQTPYIGAYRIEALSTDPKTGLITTKIVELQPVTMDSAFADDMDDSDNQAENVGRFCPLHPDDCNGKYNDFSSSGPGVASAYHFATRLFDFVSVNAPSDDYMPNVGPENVLGSIRRGIANVKPSIINAYYNGSQYTEDNVPTDGLININTAPWRVLAALPMSNDATTNQNLAKAIVLYRDGDGTGANPAHGPFHSIFELNAVPNFRTTFGSYGVNGANSFSVHGTDQGVTDADLAPFVVTGNDNVQGDFKKQFLALTRISNLVTVRSDSFTAYVIVQGWRNAGTAAPELVVQRRAAFIADRSGVTPTNKVLNVTNMPVN